MPHTETGRTDDDEDEVEGGRHFDGTPLTRPANDAAARAAKERYGAFGSAEVAPDVGMVDALQSP